MFHQGFSCFTMVDIQPNGSLPPDFASPGSPSSWLDIRRHALLLGLGMNIPKSEASRVDANPPFSPQKLMFNIENCQFLE